MRTPVGEIQQRQQQRGDAMNDNGKKFSNVGASSILMIFVILCLTIFGLLSLVSAQSEAKLSDKSKTFVENYYAADAQTELSLAQIDSILAETRNDVLSDNGSDIDRQTQYLIIVSQKLSGVDFVKIANDGKSINIIVPVGKDGKMNINTTVNILPTDNIKRYEVVSRKLASESSEESLPGFAPPIFNGGN